MKPRREVGRPIVHLLSQFIEIEPLPRIHFCGVGDRVSGRGADEKHVVLVLDAAAGWICGAVDERRTGLQIAPQSHLFPQPSLTSGLSGFSLSGMTATGVRPGEGPQALLGAALLQEQRPAIGAEYVNRKGQVQHPLAGMGGNEVGCARWLALRVTENYLARISHFPALSVD
jgi:hypothetical protein